MVNEYAAFLDAIRANPADDLPRLMAADWLEEHGETERAEMIRDLVANPTKHWYPNMRGILDIPDHISFGVVRGFVNWVGCTLADWVGGECSRCRGVGYLGPPAHGQHGFIGTPPCPACSGTGRTHAHGPAIARMGAMEKVTLTDQKPSRFPNLEGEIYSWYAAGRMGGHAWVPYDLYRYLGNTSGIANFDTEQAAMDALSDACIRWALNEKGRPEAA